MLRVSFSRRRPLCVAVFDNFLISTPVLLSCLFPSSRLSCFSPPMASFSSCTGDRSVEEEIQADGYILAVKISAIFHHFHLFLSELQQVKRWIGCLRVDDLPAGFSFSFWSPSLPTSLLWMVQQPSSKSIHVAADQEARTSTRVCSVLFCSVLFCSVLFCSVPFRSVPFHSVPFRSGRSGPVRSVCSGRLFFLRGFVRDRA